MNKSDRQFVTIVYDEYEGEILEGTYTELHVIAIYKNADDADHDFPWHYKETKLLRTTTHRNQSDEAS